MNTKSLNISNLTLLVALALSSVAAFYSIMGLTAIFAGAVIPIIIMGTILEIGKITATVWLKTYWNESSKILKAYLIPAVVILALITSMGIFGFLSKAHSEVNLASNDTLVKLSTIDEKINIQKENIENARKTLQQLDSQVESRMNRAQSEQGVERSVAIRKQQNNERVNLQKEIAVAQQAIAKLNEERVPLAVEIKKIEAEVGPIKYIAAFLYEDNPSAELLERAVRWVIILLVIVFDPLAITLVLAANASRDWESRKLENRTTLKDPIIEPLVAEQHPISNYNDNDNNIVTIAKQKRTKKSAKKTDDNTSEPIPDTIMEIPKAVSDEESISNENPKVKEDTTEKIPTTKTDIKFSTTDTIMEVGGNYVVYEDKMVSKDALKVMRPDLFYKLEADNIKSNQSSTNFGTQFPKFANKGDIFVRIDTIPNKVFKFAGAKWIEINKNTTTAYLHNDDYLQFLVSKIETGEYDIELLSDIEKEQVETHLKLKNK